MSLSFGVLRDVCLVSVSVLWLFLTVPLSGLQCVIVAFPDRTHLLFASYLCLVPLVYVSDASLLRNRYGGSGLSLKNRSGCLSYCILALIRVLPVFQFNVIPF